MSRSLGIGTCSGVAHVLDGEPVPNSPEHALDEAEVVGNEARPKHVLQHELIAAAEIDHRVGADLGGMAENVGEARDVAEARQCDRIAWACAAVEVGDRVVGVAMTEHERIVAAASGQRVVTGIALKPVVERVSA
jgi:hypothetical protein